MKVCVERTMLHFSLKALDYDSLLDEAERIGQEHGVAFENGYDLEIQAEFLPGKKFPYRAEVLVINTTDNRPNPMTMPPGMAEPPVPKFEQ